METKEITMLRQEIELMRTQVAALEREIVSVKRLQDYDRTRTLKHIADCLRDLDDYIFPTFHKVFPNYSKTSRQISGIILNRTRPEGDKRD